MVSSYAEIAKGSFSSERFVEKGGRNIEDVLREKEGEIVLNKRRCDMGCQTEVRSVMCTSVSCQTKEGYCKDNNNKNDDDDYDDDGDGYGEW